MLPSCRKRLADVERFKVRWGILQESQRSRQRSSQVRGLTDVSERGARDHGAAFHHGQRWERFVSGPPMGSWMLLFLCLPKTLHEPLNGIHVLL